MAWKREKLEAAVVADVWDMIDLRWWRKLRIYAEDVRQAECGLSPNPALGGGRTLHRLRVRLVARRHRVIGACR